MKGRLLLAIGTAFTLLSLAGWVIRRGNAQEPGVCRIGFQLKGAKSLVWVNDEPCGAVDLINSVFIRGFPLSDENIVRLTFTDGTQKEEPTVQVVQFIGKEATALEELERKGLSDGSGVEFRFRGLDKSLLSDPDEFQPWNDTHTAQLKRWLVRYLESLNSFDEKQIRACLENVDPAKLDGLMKFLQSGNLPEREVAKFSDLKFIRGKKMMLVTTQTWDPLFLRTSADKTAKIKIETLRIAVRGNRLCVGGDQGGWANLAVPE